MTRLLLIAAIVACVGLAIAGAARLDIVLFNPSASVPSGFYMRDADAPAARGDFVTVRARDVAPAYARARDFVDSGDRFLAHPGIEWVS